MGKNKRKIKGHDTVNAVGFGNRHIHVDRRGQADERFALLGGFAAAIATRSAVNLASLTRR